MNSVHGVGAGHAARMEQSQGADHSRRPGSANHPGKHLGQMKHAEAPMDATTAMPLVQQQLNALGTGGNNTVKASSQASQQDALYAQMIMNDMNQFNANINDELKFMSRFGAISTAF